MITFNELNNLYPIKLLLEHLNLQKISEKPEYFKFSSPFKEDKTPSMVLYKSNLMCIDFSSQYRKSLFTLVKDLTGKTLYEVTGINKSGINNIVFENSLKNKQRDFPSRIKSVKIQGMMGVVDRYEEALSYCQRRNIFKDFRKNFNINYMPSGRINNTYFGKRVCIPIEENGKTVSMEGRDVTGESKVKVLYPRGAYVSTLFNIDNLKKNQTLVVVEGILDIPKIWKFFTKNVTTTFGVSINNNQKELLNQFSDIILFPDGDEAGRTMIDEFDSFYDHEFKIAYIDKLDPGEASVKDIEKVLLNPILSTEWFLENSGLFETPTKRDFFSN